jgi:hypothetical protein
MEFYASTSGAVTRLNIKGEQVWNRPSTLPDLLELVAPDAAGPAWIVSTRYGVSVDVWSPDGTSIAEMKWPDGRVHGVVGWLGARSLVAGDSTARGFAIDGTTRFEIPVDDPLRVMQVTTWKPSAGSPELLVLVAGGDRHLERWRMRVYASPDAVVYEEVFNAWPRAFKARAADGTATLFIKTGDTLSVLRPVNTSR